MHLEALRYDPTTSLGEVSTCSALRLLQFCPQAGVPAIAEHSTLSLRPTLPPTIMGKSSAIKRDVYFRAAKEDGYRARSAYKLLGLNDQVSRPWSARELAGY